MTQPTFCTHAHGKWILAGEHTVMRKHPAIAAPLKQRSLYLDYQPGAQPLTFTIQGLDHIHIQDAITPFIHHVCAQLLPNKHSPSGHITLDNHIPVGRGLGFSAALSVVITRWLIHLGWVHDTDWFDFAKRLEHYAHHGKSSGMDILAAASTQQLLYIDGQNTRPITPTLPAYLRLSDSGQTGITQDAIRQVAAWSKENPTKALHTDQQMAQAVTDIHHCLCNNLADAEQRITQLAHAIKQAQQCFVTWKLVPHTVAQQIDRLYTQGARAVKITGAGLGGYLLSLWDNPPPERPNTFINIDLPG